MRFSVISTHVSAGIELTEETLLAAARKVGLLTASVGKVGPAAVYDITERSGEETIIIDDLTGRTGGLPLSTKTLEALQKASLPSSAPARGDNARTGDAKTREPIRRTLTNKATSPMSRPKQYCRYLKPQENRSCWCSGRATRMERNTIRVIVWANSCLGSMVPLRKQRSRTPTITWRQFWKLLKPSASMQQRTSSSARIMAFHRFPKTAKLARRLKSVKRMFRAASCRPDSSPSTSRKPLNLPLFDPDAKLALWILVRDSIQAKQMD